MPLSDTVIRNIKASRKTKRLFDGGGLYLEAPGAAIPCGRTRLTSSGTLGPPPVLVVDSIKRWIEKGE